MSCWRARISGHDNPPSLWIQGQELWPLNMQIVFALIFFLTVMFLFLFLSLYLYIRKKRKTMISLH